MSKPDDWAFSFEEADHLTRIHLKLALEDVGFRVEEADDVIGIADTGREPIAETSSLPSRDCTPAFRVARGEDAPPDRAKGEDEGKGEELTPAGRWPTASCRR